MAPFDNLPRGTIHHTTLASSADTKGNEVQTFTLQGPVFLSGDNLLAVEVHQTSLTSYRYGL